MAAPLTPQVLALIQKLAETGDLGPEDGICKRVLSIHDHWLSEEEARYDTVSFATLGSLQEYRFYLSEEDKFVRLLAALFRSGEAYYFEATNGTVQPLASWQKLLDLVTGGLREKQPFRLWPGRHEVVLASSFDLNVAAYFLRPEAQPAFAEQAGAYGLFLL